MSQLSNNRVSNQNNDLSDFDPVPEHQDEVVKRLKQIHLKRLGDQDEDEDYLRPTPHNIAELLCLTLQNVLIFFLLPIYIMACFVTVEPNQAIVFTSFGKIRKVIKEPGCHYNPLLNPERISTKVETLQIKGSSVPDLKGSPMVVSAIVNYKIIDPIKTLYAVDNY